MDAARARADGPVQGASGWTGWTSGVCVMLGAMLGFALVATHRALLSDERFHGGQIWHLHAGNWEILGNITMIPTYHAVLALVARWLRIYDDMVHRAVTLIGALTIPWIAWRSIARRLPSEAGRRVLQLWFFPLLFPFCFLIYTDAWAAAAVLATAMFALERRPASAAAAGAVAFLLRQDTILWSALALWLVMWEDVERGPWTAALRRLSSNALRRGWPLLLLLVAFAAFVGWNGGVAVGDRGAHQGGVSFGNAYSFLIWSWFLLLPHNLEAAPRIRSLLERRPAGLLLLGGAFLAYMGTYSNPHPYNQADLLEFLHNQLLHALSSSALVRALAFLPIAWMVLTAWTTPLREGRLNWLYPAALASAAMHPLIEPRYYLPALLLFLLWRPAMSDGWENGSLLYGMTFSVVMLFGTVTGAFFI